MIIALAGLPGTGKSFLAGRLAADLGGVVLSKDVVRPALFPPAVLDYSREQDDIVMAAVYAAAAHLRRTRPAVPVLIDGRTFSRRYQVDDLFAAAAGVGEEPAVIECVCSADVAADRLGRDRAAGTHPAGNRNAELYERQRAAADPLVVPRLTVDTGLLPPDECVGRCRLYLAGFAPTMG